MNTSLEKAMTATRKLKLDKWNNEFVSAITNNSCLSRYSSFNSDLQIIEQKRQEIPDFKLWWNFGKSDLPLNSENSQFFKGGIRGESQKISDTSHLYKFVLLLHGGRKISYKRKYTENFNIISVI